MSLDKFVPLSPDPDLNTGADMTLARFGHLNKLVDEINSGGGAGGGGLIDAGEGTCSSIRINVDNQAFGEYGSALGGSLVKTCNDYTASYFGRQSCAIGCYSSVNGTSNVVVARNSHILSGNNNTIACDATHGIFNASGSASYSGNYFGFCVTGATPQIVTGSIYATNCDLTAFWPSGSTFSFTYIYACGVPATGSCYSQIQGIDIPVICSVYNGSGFTCLLFCYDPALPNFQGVVCGSYSYGYLQKTGTFSDYGTTCSNYHPNVIVGGTFNTINGYSGSATISGGYNNAITGGYAAIIGGNDNYMCNNAQATIAGGYYNRVNFSGPSLITGAFNAICSSRYSLISGSNNCITCSNYSYIGGRDNDITNTNHSFIGVGYDNRISSTTTGSLYSSINSGMRNTLCDSKFSHITGAWNTITGIYIQGNDYVSKQHNFITGVCNTITCSCNSIAAGYFNNITSLCDSYVVGSCITADRNCATFVNNLSITNLPSSAAGLPSKSLWYDPATCTVKFVP